MVGGGACIGYDEIRSMSGQYTSYWNTFLFNFLLPTFSVNTIFIFKYLIICISAVDQEAVPCSGSPVFVSGAFSVTQTSTKINSEANALHILVE